MSIDIFANATPMDGEWFKFKKIGDSIQGTYIDARNGVDGFGNQQTIYVLLDQAGKVWNLGFRLTATVIHERMKGVKPGQIVGFRFDEERDSKRTPGVKVKIIRVYADTKVVNQEWLENHKDSGTQFTPQPSASANANGGPDLSYGFDDDEEFEAPADAGAASGSMPTANDVAPATDAIQAIRDLAKSKGLVKEGMTVADMDAAIEKYTGFALSEENLTKIIIALTGYQA